MRAKRYATPNDDRRRNGPVNTVRPDPDVWRAAVRLAGGDPRRCRTLPDGSVVVENKPRRTR